MDLEGKTALVTGGSGDIGGAIARALAQAGADVAISYVGHKRGAAATIDAVWAAGKRSLAVQLDQCDPVSIDAAVDTVVAGLGRVDILVNNAAWNIGIPFSDLAALTADVWDRIMDTNLRGPYLDRKSTRLNSSHRCISYAVFCLKKTRRHRAPC